jgi:DnaJ-class molecular chaperone
MTERSERMKITSTAMLDCPNCGGSGGIAVSVTRMAHHPYCDGSCRLCPVQEQDWELEPCQMCEGRGKLSQSKDKAQLRSEAE